MQVQVSLKIEVEATASLTQMEHHIQEAGKPAMREAMKQAIRGWEDQHPACPHCGATQRRLEGTTRRVLATQFGRVQVPRRRFRCQACWRRYCPANMLFAALKGGTISAPLQEAAMLAGCSWPYRVAANLLKRLSGAQISAEEIRLLTNQHGKQRAMHQQEEAEQVCATASQEAPTAQTAEAAQVPSAQHAQPPMLVGVDGGWVCSREQRGGMEGKVAVVCSQVEDLPMRTPSPSFVDWCHRAQRHPPRQRHRLKRRRYVATFGPSKQIGSQAKAAALRLCDDLSRKVTIIADGADWIKKEQGKHFPQATCILDWAHLWREVRHAINAVAQAKPLSKSEREYQLHLHRSWLWHGDVDHAVQGLRNLSAGLPAEALKPIKGTITYLEHQRPWIGSYERWKAQGYPVGSGMIERAVAIVINRRMKKRGMCWCRRNATAIVALRCDLLNDDWITPQRLRAFP
ncbi:MAG: ISKra4 family transposase [Chloroflexi bacterium]|nr:ISKra4 family transposase [Chloroflexota bacterium]